MNATFRHAIALGLVLGLGGWRSALACPEEPDGRPDGAEAAVTPAGQFGGHPRLASFDGGPDDGDVRERLERLEAQMRRLTEQLERMTGNRDRDRDRGRQPPQGQRPDEGRAIMRDYHLSKGKLKMLSELMVRDDVPVLVSVHDDHITVHGPARHQEIFGAFVRLIDPQPPRPADGGDAAPMRFEGNDDRGPDQDARFDRRPLEARRQELEADRMSRQSELLRQKAERMRRRAGGTAARMHEHHDRQGPAAGDLRGEVSREFDQLELEALQLEHEAEALAQEADMLREKAWMMLQQATPIR